MSSLGDTDGRLRRGSSVASRNAVLAAAMVELGRVGLESTTVSAVASQAEVSPAYVHRLFGSKSDLMAVVIERNTELVLEQLHSYTTGSEIGDSVLAAFDAALERTSDLEIGLLRRQLHVWGAAYRQDVGDDVRGSFRATWDEVARASGADSEITNRIMARYVLLTVLASLDLMEFYPRAADT